MGVYLVLRRGAWRTPDELHGALRRSSAESEPLSIGWLRSYVLAELDGTLGTVCVHDAASPEGVRLHAYRAALPVDEIVGVADILVGDDGVVTGSGVRSAWDTGGEGGST
jgi:hypothetical protein